MKNKALRKVIALIIAVALTLTTLPGMAAAESNCNHFHDNECGYVETAPCAFVHEHDEACGYDTEAETGCGFVHEHDEACGYIEADAQCGHVHGAACGGLTLGDSGNEAQAITFDMPLNESGETTFYLTEGVPVTNADLLAGVRAADENGDPVPVTVKDAGGLDMDNPVLKRLGILPEPYVITYEAAHPVTSEIVTAERECYVTLATAVPMALLFPSALSAGTYTIAASGADVILDSGSDSCVLTSLTEIYVSSGDLALTVSADVTIKSIKLDSGNLIINGANTLTMEKASVSGDVTVSGTLIANNSDSAGIEAGGSLVIDGGTVTANSNAWNGVWMKGGGITVKNSGSLTANSNRSPGIYVPAGYGLTIDGGAVTANLNYDGNGVCMAGGNITVENGGMLTTNMNAYPGIGVASGYNLSIDGGSVTANENSSNGVWMEGGNIIIENGGSLTSESNSYNGVYAVGSITVGAGCKLAGKNTGTHDFYASSGFTVNGVMIGYGTAASDMYSGGAPTISGTGIIIAVDSAAAPLQMAGMATGLKAWKTGDNLSGDGTATASWALESGKSGVTNSLNNIFVELTGFAVITPGSSPSGSCGAAGNETNVTWTYDPAAKTLTVAGTGAMADYASESDAPWYLYVTGIETVKIENGVTNISDYAFYDYTDLTAATIASSVTTIGNSAFRNCMNLTLNALPSGLTAIGNNAFQSCTNLALNMLPSGVTTIGNNAFYRCSGLTLATLPDGITTIGNYTFYNCAGLTLAALPSGVTTIGNSAFYGCTDITLTALPDGVTTIGQYAFRGCTNLNLTALPNGVTTIGIGAFYGCAGLIRLELPASLTSMGTAVFSSCTNLETLIFTGVFPGGTLTSIVGGGTGCIAYYPSTATGYDTWNPGGSWTKTAYTVGIFTAQPANASVTAGQDATFSVVAGTPAPTSYQWQFSINNGSTWSNISSENSDSLTLTGVTTGMSGNQYRCVATNAVYSTGVESSAATLTVSAGVNTPIATVANVTVSGTTGTTLSSQTATITLTDDTVITNGLSNVTATSWFTGLPAGITAMASGTGGGTTITVTFGGTPAAISSAAFIITIPANALTSNTNLAVTANASAKFDITAPTTHTATLTVNKDGAAYTGHGKTFTLKLSTDETVTHTMNGANGTVTATVGNGTWKVYDGATDTGVTITINNAAGNATLNYFTIQFSSSHAGGATGSDISATYNGGAIITGAVVLGGKTLTVTATGAGATTYSFAWSGTASGSGATYSTFVNAAVNAVCTVTGSSSGSTITGISVKTQPTKLTYTEGETLNLTGLVATLSWSAGSDNDVPFADFGTYGITMSYTGGGAASQGDTLTVAAHNSETITLSIGSFSDETDPLTVQPNVAFTVTNPGGGVDLQNPSDLIFEVDNAGLLAGYGFLGVRFMNVTAGTNYGQTLYDNDVGYSNGVLTVPATLFGQHNSGTPLTPGTYRAQITFEDGVGGYYDYYADFELTSGSGGTTYLLTVQNGTGGGNYTAGTPVTITANAAPSGKEFDKWMGGNGGTFANENSATTTFTMPGNAATVMATYKNIGGGSHTITATAGTGGGISPSGAVSVNDGGSQIFTISSNANYSIRDVTVDGTSVGARSSYTFNNVTAGHTIHATFNYIGGDSGNGGSGGGASGGGYKSPSTSTDNIIVNTISVPYSKTGALLTSNVTGQTLRSIVDNAYKAEDGNKTVKINYNGVSGSASLTSLTLTFNASKLKADEDVTFIIETPFGVFIYTRLQMLEWFDGGFGTYTITLEKSSLKVDVKKGGKSIVWNSLTPMARIGVPYTLKTGESTANLNLTDKNGRVLPTSVYEKGMVYADIFALGTYKAVDATPNPFTDTTGHWAKASIDYVTIRGLISGASGTTFAPGTAITRADFLMALGKLSGANVSGYKQSSFTDVSNSSVCMPYIEWAAKNNIVTGIGNGKFAPDSPITREQMAQMMANYAKALGYALPTVNSAASYADSAKISAWAKDAVTAMQKADIMTGKDGNLFDPQGSTTRAEAATILRRFVENVISSCDAEGWSNANNDLSKRVYYTRNGVALTGWQTIGGARYYFGSEGVMRTSWLDMDDKRYYFYANGNMVSGEWVHIGGKWYYFREDGTLATNTTIDGYEVGADGARK